jgi:hypothetical protein
MPSDFHVVASECLGLVKPMLDALRSGDRKKIDAYGDITPVSMDDYYSAYSAMLPQNNIAPQKRQNTTLSEKAVLKLLELGVEPAQAKRLSGKVLAEHYELRKVADVVRVAYTLYLSQSEPAAKQEPQPGDLRASAGYDDMKVGGTISKGKW